MNSQRTTIPPPHIGMFVVPAADIDLESSLDGGQAFRWWQEADGYRGVIGDRAVHLSAVDGGIQVELVGDGRVEGLVGEVRDYLGLGYDMSSFREAFSDDPCIGPALRGYHGLRLLRQDPWECLVSFICSATSNIPRIKLNVGSVATTLGTRVGPGERDFAFPAPSVVAEAGEARLRTLGLGFRAKFVALAAETVASGRLDLMSLRSATYVEAREALTALHGVGEKIADCVLAFSLDKPESFPVDRWTRRALEKWYGLPAGHNNTKASEWARAIFRGHGAVAQQYMFHRERLLGRAQAWGGKHVERALDEDAAVLGVERAQRDSSAAASE